MKTRSISMKPRSAWTALLAAAVLATSVQARAAEPTPEDRERARVLLFDGRDKLKAGDTAAAVRSFQAAHAIMGVPTTGLDLAKGLVELGKLIEARTIALEVTRMPAQPSEPRAFVNARAAAAALADELNARIPALVLTVKDPPGAVAQVLVDGTPVPAEAFGLPWKVNPGDHVVAAAAAGFKAERRTVTVKDRESLPVELSLSPEAAAPPPPRPAPPAQPGARADGATSPGGDAAADGGREIPAYAWIAGGAGVIALGVGVAFAIDYANVRSTVDGDCPADLCAWDRYDDASANALEARWNRSLGLAVGLGAAGLLGIGAAVYGIALAPAAAPSDAGRGRARRDVAVAPWIGGEVTGAAVSGRF